MSKSSAGFSQHRGQSLIDALSEVGIMKNAQSAAACR
jgi:hypothetical protein